MKAKKSLGQHFLKSEKALAAIVDAGDIHADDIVLEIGPGTGILTNKLTVLAGKVIAVEKDRELVSYLEENFADAIVEKHLKILSQDILRFDPEILRFYGKSYKVVANIPYYITGAIIEKFLSASYQPERMVLLMQKEVAERIVARDGKESVLSLAVKAYGTPQIVAKVPRGSFTPPPKVDSAVLAIDAISRKFFADLSVQAGCNEDVFFALIKACFGKKRAQIGRSLGEYIGDKDGAKSILEVIGIDPKTRPEDIELTLWKRVANALVK